MTRITEAAEAVAGGRLEAARRALVDAWRVNRHPRVADVNDLVQRAVAAQVKLPPLPGGQRKVAHHAWLDLAGEWSPAALARLGDGLMHGTSTQAKARLEVLLKWGDPAVTWLVLGCLERPAYRALTARPFLVALGEGLVKLRDGRALDRLRTLSLGYGAVIPTSVGEQVGRDLRRAAAKLERVRPPRALGPDDLAALTRIEQAFSGLLGDQRRAASAHAQRTQALGRLLDAVLEQPADDGARQIYADALTEHGDLRGEFITLQLLPERTPAQDERMTALQLAHGEAWLGALAPAVNLEGYRRGFPANLSLWKNKAALKGAVGHPLWATVETLWSRVQDGPLATIRQLVLHSALRGLRELLVAPKVLLPALDAHPAIDAVGGGPDEDFDPLEVAHRRPRWRRFHLRGAVRPSVLAAAAFDQLVVCLNGADALAAVEAAEAADVTTLVLSRGRWVSPAMHPNGLLFELRRGGPRFTTLVIRAGWSSSRPDHQRGEIEGTLAAVAASLRPRRWERVVWQPTRRVTAGAIFDPLIAVPESRLREVFRTDEVVLAPLERVPRPAPSSISLLRHGA